MNFLLQHYIKMNVSICIENRNEGQKFHGYAVRAWQNVNYIKDVLLGGWLPISFAWSDFSAIFIYGLILNILNRFMQQWIHFRVECTDYEKTHFPGQTRRLLTLNLILIKRFKLS